MAAAARKNNWFAIGISIAVVVVLVALGAVVVYLNNQATDAGPAPKGEIINAETGALSFGDGKDTVAVFVDFMCPICGQFETAYGPEILDLVNDGTITLNIHPIAILDRYSQGTAFSTRAANAMYCVAENNSDKALEYLNTLFANQPAEGSTGLTDDQLKYNATR